MPLSTLNFYGFEPGQDMRKLIGHRISQIMDEAPSGAAVVVSFQTAQDEQIEGTFSIHSTAGAFKTKVSSPELEDVVGDLVGNIHQQLKDWRRERFADNAPA